MREGGKEGGREGGRERGRKGGREGRTKTYLDAGEDLVQGHGMDTFHFLLERGRKRREKG